MAHAPLPIVLPQPVFEGTPQNLRVPNLEKPRYKALRDGVRYDNILLVPGPRSTR